MSRQDRNSWYGVISSLAWPLLIGLALSAIFFVLILRGPLKSELTYRYFASHPVSMSEVVLFFVGLSALILKLADVVRQSRTMHRLQAADPEQDELAVEDGSSWLDRLAQLPAALRNSHLGTRLHDALEHVCRHGSAAGLDDELKYLSDMDLARQQESYSLVRIIIWATPMLGFLGTVVGITAALGDLDPQLLATDPKSAMQGLLAGLYVAFDTTAEALSLSILLMFIQFLVERGETHLLSIVDERAADALLGRFAEEGGSDGQLAAVQRMANAVLKTTEKMVQDQTDHWKHTIDGANAQWQQLLENSGKNLQTALATALDTSLRSFSDRLSLAEQQTDERLRARWEQWQTVLSDNARLLHSQQSELVHQGEIMTQVLTATGDVLKLEQALNDNLRALAGARHFEETVMSLSAAIHLLNSRMSELAFGPGPVELVKNVKQGRAA